MHYSYFISLSVLTCSSIVYCTLYILLIITVYVKHAIAYFLQRYQIENVCLKGNQQILFLAIRCALKRAQFVKKGDYFIQ